LFAGQERFLVTFESIEGRALIVVGTGRVGVKADSLLTGDECFSVAPEVTEDGAFATVWLSEVGVKANGLLVGGECCPVALEFIEGKTLLQPITSCLGRDQQVFDDLTDLFDHIVKGFIAVGPARDGSGIGWK